VEELATPRAGAWVGHAAMVAAISGVWVATAAKPSEAVEELAAPKWPP